MNLSFKATTKISFSFWSLVFALLLTSSPSIAADWNQWRGPDRTGYSSDSAAIITKLPSGGIAPLWVSEPIKSARDGGWGSPVVAQGIVYLFTHQKELVGEDPGKKQFPFLSPEKRTHLTAEEFKQYEINRRDEDEARSKAFQFREFIYAFDQQTGEPVWVNQDDSTYSRFPQSGCPTIHGGRLYILGAGRQARCLDAQSGKELWNTPLPGEFRDEFYQASVLINDGIAIFNATGLFGLDTTTGEIIWQASPGNQKGTHSSPTLWQHDEQSYCLWGISNGHTVCIDPQTGSELWRIESMGGNASPVVKGDYLLVFGNSRKKGLRCYELSLEGAKPIWTYHQVTDKGCTPFVTDSEVYVQGEKKLACVDLKTGNELWLTYLDSENTQYSSPIGIGETGFYAYDSLLSFALTRDEYRPQIDGLIDQDRQLIDQNVVREKYQLDNTDLSPEERKKNLRLFQKQVGTQGPLKCATPAAVDGYLFVRLSKQLVCYDLRANP